MGYGSVGLWSCIIILTPVWKDLSYNSPKVRAKPAEEGLWTYGHARNLAKQYPCESVVLTNIVNKTRHHVEIAKARYSTSRLPRDYPTKSVSTWNFTARIMSIICRRPRDGEYDLKDPDPWAFLVRSWEKMPAPSHRLTTN